MEGDGLLMDTGVNLDLLSIQRKNIEEGEPEDLDFIFVILTKIEIAIKLRLV